MPGGQRADGRRIAIGLVRAQMLGHGIDAAGVQLEVAERRGVAQRQGDELLIGVGLDRHPIDNVADRVARAHCHRRRSYCHDRKGPLN